MTDDQSVVGQLQAVLRTVAELHHNTVTPSRLHDPEHTGIEDCPCKTCRAAVAALALVPELDPLRAIVALKDKVMPSPVSTIGHRDSRVDLFEQAVRIAERALRAAR